MRAHKKLKLCFSVCLLFALCSGNISIPAAAAEKTGLETAQVAVEDAQNYVPGEILVKYKRKQTLSVLTIPEGASVAAKITELERDPAVAYAEANAKRFPSDIATNDPDRGLVWALDNVGQTVAGITGTPDADIDAPEAWAISEAAPVAPVVVAVIDTGVAYAHSDLAGSMWDGSSCKNEHGVSLAGGCNHGYDFEDGDTTPLPTTSAHGTRVAGTIASLKGNGLGAIGVAPQAKIMALKFGFDVASEIQAIDFAIQNGAGIINASYGGGPYSQAEYDAIGRFRNVGGIFVAAAGNSAANNDAIHNYPSDYDLDNIIAVAATDQQDNLAAFSSYGAASIDVGAPGVNAYSATAEAASLLDETFASAIPPAIPGGWTATGNWGTRAEGSGAVLYGDLTVPYAAAADTTITSPSYDLVAGGASLDFWTACDTEYTTTTWADYMALEYSSDGGSTFSEVLRWDEAALDADNNPDGSATYHVRSLSIPDRYATGNFTFRFHWITNNNADTGSTGGGCFVDDIQLVQYGGSQASYGYSSGTSLAAPQVAGLAALAWGYKPSLTFAEVKSAIVNNGDPLAALQGKTVTGKRINAQKTLQSLLPPTPTPVVVPDNPPGNSGGGDGGGGGGGGGGEEPEQTPVPKKGKVLGAVTKISLADRKAKDFIRDKQVPAVVERIFRQLFGRKPTKTESTYWKGRARSNSATEKKLGAAMKVLKVKGRTIPKK